MSTLQVANIQFETTGTNRIDFPSGGNTIFFRSENIDLTANVLINGNAISSGITTGKAIAMAIVFG